MRASSGRHGGVGSRVEQFEQIRRDRDREGLSIRALAVVTGCIAGRCRQALASAVPPAKRAPVGRPAPKLGPYRAVIDAWLEADREAPRKQRHTARRICQRLVDEHGAEVAERRCVGTCGRASARAGVAGRGGVRAAGSRAGGGGRGRLGRGARWCRRGRDEGASVRDARVFSGAAFCQASLVETQQAFLELHVQAFEWFGGVFATVWFDNLKSAVKQVLKGRRRVETDRFVALRSHYLFESQFTTPGSKGPTRREAWRARSAGSGAATWCRSRMLRDLAELNALLLAGCEAGSRPADRRAAGDGRGGVGEERPLLLALPAEPFDACETGAAGGRQGAGDGPPEPLLGAGRARRAEGLGQDRRAARSRSATAAGRSPATSGCTASSAPAPSSITTSSCSPASPARSSGRSRCVRSATGALAGLLRSAVGGADRALRALGRRPADGRCAAALPRARARQRRAGGPRRADRRRARRSRGRCLARRARAPAGAPRPLDRLEPGWPRTIGPPPKTSPTTTSCATGRRDDEPARAVLPRWKRSSSTDQIDWMRRPACCCQLVTVMMSDDTCEAGSRRSACSPPAQARSLAFELLVRGRARRAAHPPPIRRQR